MVHPVCLGVLWFQTALLEDVPVHQRLLLRSGQVFPSTEHAQANVQKDKHGIKSRNCFGCWKKKLYVSSIDSVIAVMEKLWKSSQMTQGLQKMPSEERCKDLSDDFIPNYHVSTRKDRKYWALKNSPSCKGRMSKGLCLRGEVLCTAFVAGNKLDYALEQISNLHKKTVKCFGT